SLRYRYDGAQLPAGAAVRVVSSTLAGKLHAGVYEADAAFEVVDSDGAVNGNYAVRSVAGTYTILPQKAELRWSDAAKALMTQNGAAFEKTYDGAAFNVRSEWLELYSAAGYRFDAFAIASVQCDSLIRVKTEMQTDEFGYFVEVVVKQPLNLRNPRAALKDGTEVYTSDLEITLSSEVSGQTVLVKKRALSCVIQSITVSKTITEEEFESLYPDLDSLAQLSAATPLAPTDTSASVLFSVDYDLTDNVLEAYKAGGAKILNSLGEDVTDCYSFSYAEGMIFRV
ncbi:MAG: hypothetical protein K2H43_06175, partial [Clostridia bacterium]|nr:hypothetical protein [Clostridia bacterium]